MIDFPSRAPAATARRGAAANNDRPKAQFWLNVGYHAGEGDQRKFVSLPTGIPLDTQERLATNSQNADYAQFQGARNELLDFLTDAASKLAPGEEELVNLSIQIRRVNEAVAAPTGEANIYSLANAGLTKAA